MSDVEEAVTRVHHEEWARVVATLTRRFGDLDVAEEAAAEAFAAAVERWPADGIPPNPGAWLTTTANRKAIDRIRRTRAPSAFAPNSITCGSSFTNPDTVVYRARARQQHLPLPQPPHPIGEDRFRAVARRPPAGRDPRGELALQHRPRHVQRIFQERPEPADGHQLEGEPEHHVLAAPPPDQGPVLVIEEEHPPQIRLRRRTREPPVRGRLIISQELHSIRKVGLTRR